jgi:hypothetical protein
MPKEATVNGPSEGARVPSGSGPSELSQWILSQIGPGRPFSSARQLAIKAGLNQNAVNIIIDKGRAEPETLLKLAEATGTPRIKLFILSGWLSPQDCNALATPLLSVEEEEVLRMYRETPPDLRGVVLAALRAAWQQQSRQ